MVHASAVVSGTDQSFASVAGCRSRVGSSDILGCERVLDKGGRLAILMGGYEDREAGYCPLVYHTQRICFDLNLKQTCTQIIRFSHGASSSKKTYRSSFIPDLHDVCTIVEKI